MRILGLFRQILNSVLLEIISVFLVEYFLMPRRWCKTCKTIPSSLFWVSPLQDWNSKIYIPEPPTLSSLFPGNNSTEIRNSRVTTSDTRSKFLLQRDAAPSYRMSWQIAFLPPQSHRPVLQLPASTRRGSRSRPLWQSSRSDSLSEAELLQVHAATPVSNTFFGISPPRTSDSSSLWHTQQ